MKTPAVHRDTWNCIKRHGYDRTLDAISLALYCDGYTAAANALQRYTNKHLDVLMRDYADTPAGQRKARKAVR